MTKEERIAARKKTMADIVAKRDATIAREKNKSSSAKEKRAKRNTDFSAKVKEVNRTRKAKQGGRLSARGSEGYKPADTRRGPTMGTVNKEGVKGGGGAEPAKSRGPSGPTMTSMGGAKLKPRNKDKKVKPRRPSGPSMTGFRKGGSIDGCAKRGLTRAKGSS